MGPHATGRLLADPLTALSGMPAHTQRLILAQSLLMQQQRHLQVMQQRHWAAVRAAQWQEAEARRRAQEEEAARAREEAERKKRAEEERERRKTWWREHVDDDDDDGDAADENKNRNRNKNNKTFPGVARRPDGLVDLTPAPPLPPPPKPLSVDPDPDDPEAVADQWGLRKETSKGGAEGVRAAVLSAAAAAGPEALARQARVGRSSSSSADVAVYDSSSTRADANVSAGALDYARKLEADAAGAMKERKFVKAEMFLRQLLQIAGGHPSKGRNDGGSEGKDDDEKEIPDDDAESPSEPLAAAPVLYRLSQAVGKQGRRGEEKALLLRALRAVESARGPDGASDQDALVRYRVLCSLHAVSALSPRRVSTTASNDDDRARATTGTTDADVYARRALFVAERHYGPAHAQTAHSLYRLAASLCRGAAYPEAEQYLHRALSILTRTHGERHHETGRVLCALAQVYKRMCQFERAARYDKLWRLCPPPPKPAKGRRLAELTASNAAAAEKLRGDDTWAERAAAASAQWERAPPRPPPTSLGVLVDPEGGRRLRVTGPPSPTGSVASELADPLLGHFSGDLQERASDEWEGRGGHVTRGGGSTWRASRTGGGRRGGVGPVVPALDFSRLPEPETSSDEDEEA